jgi:hypothetical protein
MSKDSAKKKMQDTMAWIVVLAIAITLCSVLFFVFAVYLSSINKNLSVTNSRLAVMQENEIELLKELHSLRQNAEPKTTH